MRERVLQIAGVDATTYQLWPHAPKSLKHWGGGLREKKSPKVVIADL